jgi:hypothetical protein
MRADLLMGLPSIEFAVSGIVRGGSLHDSASDDKDRDEPDARSCTLEVACCRPSSSSSQIPQETLMNRRELIAALAERLETDKRSAEHSLQAVQDLITESVAKGEAVAISGFAKFARRGVRK